MERTLPETARAVKKIVLTPFQYPATGNLVKTTPESIEDLSATQ
jgi:hypothetical protein